MENSRADYIRPKVKYIKKELKYLEKKQETKMKI